MKAAKLRSWSGKVGLFVLITLFLFALMEGMASTILSAYSLFFGDVPVMAEQSHSEYDSLLGWVNLPDFYDANLYGDGVYFQTNSQRFRNAQNFDRAVPEGKIRLLCSGDSFTLGHSVNNDEAWCSQLATLDDRFETVNMGQGGYGVDQAYLWYLRDGAALEHDLHIFAFITPDFDRMRSDNYSGYGKPRLRAEHDTLVVENVPVPERIAAVPRFTRTLRAIRQLRMVQLGQAITERLGVEGGSPARPDLLGEEEVRAVVSKLFAHLQRVNEAKGSALAVVHLPRSSDREYREADRWRSFFNQAAERTGLVYIDLIEPFRQLPIDEGQQLFQVPYRASHYSPGGNRWVAERLYERLSDHPAVAPALQR